MFIPVENERAEMKTLAAGNARKAFHDAQFVAPEFKYSGIARRSAVGNMEAALHALSVAHTIAFREITGEYWSGGKPQADDVAA